MRKVLKGSKRPRDGTQARVPGSHWRVDGSMGIAAVAEGGRARLPTCDVALLGIGLDGHVATVLFATPDVLPAT